MDFREKISSNHFNSEILNHKPFQSKNEEKSAFTHYLNNQEKSHSKFYKKMAIHFVKDRLIQEYPAKKITNKIAENILLDLASNFSTNVPFHNQTLKKFSFIDLFAGIGGIRIAFQNLGGKCIFTSEWDKYSQQTYKANFGELPFGDITKQETKLYIPNNFEILCAGFPCQAFSIAGKRGGFEDTRGTLFFDVAEVIKKKQPKAFFLENVKGLMSHDKGRTIATILNVLRHDLGYYTPEPQVLNAKDFGVPQNRERVFIVGFRKNLKISNFQYPNPTNLKVKLKDIIEKKEVCVKYYLSTTYIETLRKHKARHQKKGNGFGYEIIKKNGIANAVVCGGMGRERNLIIDKRLKNFTPITRISGEVNREGIRKMTPREWARLQGFPEKFKIVVSDVQAYKQFGNSVAIPAIQATAQKIIETINHA